VRIPRPTQEIRMLVRIRSLVLAAALLSVAAPVIAAPEDEEPAAAAAEREITKEVLATGEGAACGDGKIAAVHYTGTFLDGKKFDSSRDRGDPFLFEVGSKSVITGWDETVAKMRVGDRWKVVIPWQKAYGERGSPGSIPPKSDLVFDIELLDIVEPKIEIVAAGTGEKPELGDIVSAHFALEVVGGEALADTRKGDPQTIQIGAPSQIRGIDIMFKRMCVGDRWKITLPPGLAFGKRGAPPRIPGDAELLVELEIVERIVPTVEVLKEGEGATPQRGQRVKVHYTGTFEDGKKFDSSRDKGTPFTFALGTGAVITGWDIVVGKMKVGERVKAVIPWQLAYGANGRGRLIPPKANLVFDIELLGIE
jgi:peptidylprolyl isomerase